MRQDSTANGTPDVESGWLIVRRDGTIVTAERRAAALLAAPDPEALVARDWCSFVALGDAHRLPIVREALSAGNGWHGILMYQYGHDNVLLSTTVMPVMRATDLAVVHLARPSAASAPSPDATPEAPSPTAVSEAVAPPPPPAPPHAGPPGWPPEWPPPSAAHPPAEAPVAPEASLPTEPPPAPAPSGRTLAEADASPEPSAAALEAHLAAHEALRDLSDAGSASRAVLQALAASVPFEWGAVLRFAAGRVDVLAAYPSPMAGAGAGAEWEASANEIAVHRSGQPRIDDDVDGRGDEGSPLARLPGFGLRSRVLVPLYGGADVAGAVVLYRSGSRAFDTSSAVLVERTVRRLGEMLAAPEASRGQRAQPTATHHAPATPREPAPPRREPRTPPPPAAETPMSHHPRIHDVPEPAVGRMAPADPSGDPSALTAGLPAERLESMGALVAGVAHELNNPLTAILGYAQILSSLDEGEREDALRTIEEEAQRAARIVRNLLAFARQRPGERRSVDLEMIIRRIIDLRRYSLEVDNVRVLTRFGHVPAVHADEPQMEQVFLNLLNNAHQALKRGGGEVVISTWQRDGHVLVSFADDGPGVPPEMRARIFEPFFTTQEVGLGEGMGLSTVYGVVTNHGGRTWVEAAPSGGANFVVELPVDGDGGTPADALPSSTAAEEPRTPRAGERRRILVVDDEPPVRALTGEILTGAGYHVVTAADGRQALRCLEAEDFALIVTDIRMPQMGAVELFGEIERRWPHLTERVLFVTGDIEGDRAQRVLSEERINYLEKPFTTQQLLRAIEAALAR